MAILAATVSGVLALSSMVATGSFRYYTLKTQQAELQQRQQVLATQVGELTSLRGLEQSAADQGLVPAGSPGFLYLADGRIEGSPAPATAPAPLPGARAGTTTPGTTAGTTGSADSEADNDGKADDADGVEDGREASDADGAEGDLG